MKINQLIAKGLSIGFLLNSLSILSYANTEIPNRYQTLEGEYITIDDSIEGNLEEIEVFGNTTQNHNNLEDIQSVGDLYVDKDGNPILDNQGRKQYKVDILSADGFNLLDLNPSQWTPEDGYPDVISKVINVKPNTQYTYKQNRVTWRGVIQTDHLGNQIKPIFSAHAQNETFTTPNDCEYIIVYCGQGDNTQPLKRQMQLYEGVKNIPFTEEQFTKGNKATILLPCQLQKVGNIADRLYWDDSKNRYIVEKNVGIIEDTRDHLNSPYEVFIDTKSINKLKGNYSPVILEGYKYLNWGYKSAPCVSHYGDDNYVRIYDDNFLNLNLNQAKEYVNDKKMYYQLKTPEYIETNITSKIKIPTYDGKTHIYVSTENSISPTLKVTVDRLPQIAKEAVAQAESDSSINNISLARMYTNMLPESLYKDQLQEQLSEIFSSDVVLDKKTATSNLDLYIKCENILMMSLSTNSITFEDFSGVEDMVKENAVQISINSSLPYSLNAYLPTEIQNSDKSNTMDKQILNIKENTESNYQTFVNTTDKIVLKDNCPAGNDLVHDIDIKLKGGIAHQKDVYKTTIKFEAQQK